MFVCLCVFAADGSPVSERTVFMTQSQAVFEWMLPPLADLSQGIVLDRFELMVTPNAGVARPITVMAPQPMGGVFGTGLGELEAGVRHDVELVAVFTTPDFRSEPTLFNFTTLSVTEEPFTLLPMQEPFTSGATSTTISWSTIEDSMFLDSIIVVTTSTRIISNSSRRKRQAPADNIDRQTLPPTATRVNVRTLPFSNVRVDVMANYAPPGVAALIIVSVFPPVIYDSQESSEPLTCIHHTHTCNIATNYECLCCLFVCLFVQSRDLQGILMVHRMVSTPWI